MKTLNANNLIFSRVKENVKGFLSIFDANIEEEIQLPEELKESLNSINTTAKNFEINGTLFNKRAGGTTRKPTRVNRIKPATMKERDVKTSKELDDEREL